MSRKGYGLAERSVATGGELFASRSMKLKAATVTTPYGFTTRTEEVL